MLQRNAIPFIDPSRRGYFAAYRPDEVNHCPGCGRSHWLIGRSLAECGFCATALPILDPGISGVGLFRSRTQDGEFLLAA